MYSTSAQIPVSIILPAHNAALYIRETIESVLKQSYTNWQLILVDDGSKDETGSIMDSYAGQNIQVFHKANSGVSDSRNFGIKHATGDVLFFLDADDVWNYNNIEEKIKYLYTKNTDAVFSACLLINEKSETLNQFLKGSENISLNDVLLAKGNYTTAPSGFAIKSKVISTIQCFDIHLSNNADTDFFIQILAKGLKIGYTPLVLWKYRIHGENMSKNVALLEKDLLYVYRKAQLNNLFYSTSFKLKCFSSIYLILAGSWWKDGQNKLKGVYYLLRSVITYPPIIIKLFQKS